MTNLKQQARTLAFTKQNVDISKLNITNKDGKTFLKYKEKFSKKILKEASKNKFSYFYYIYYIGIFKIDVILFNLFTGYNYNVAMLLKHYFESEGFYVNDITKDYIHFYISWIV